MLRRPNKEGQSQCHTESETKSDTFSLGTSFAHRLILFRGVYFLFRTDVSLSLFDPLVPRHNVYSVAYFAGTRFHSARAFSRRLRGRLDSSWRASVLPPRRKWLSKNEAGGGGGCISGCAARVAGSGDGWFLECGIRTSSDGLPLESSVGLRTARPSSAGREAAARWRGARPIFSAPAT